MKTITIAKPTDKWETTDKLQGYVYAVQSIIDDMEGCVDKFDRILPAQKDAMIKALEAMKKEVTK